MIRLRIRLDGDGQTVTLATDLPDTFDQGAVTALVALRAALIGFWGYEDLGAWAGALQEEMVGLGLDTDDEQGAE